jgi:ribosomal protein S18 acetylase RimI-like enzyme
MTLILPQIGSIAAHEFDALTTLMRETIRPLSIYNERAIQSEFAKYTEASLRALAAVDPHSIIVARDSDGLTGFCISRFDDGTIWLSWFGTAARARGRGIGAALLAALAATLPARDAHKIWCDSRTENEKSKSVLERAGYRRITTLVNHWYRQDYFLWEYYP